MCDVPVFYATSEGHTRRIAERLADQIRRHGFDSRAIAIVSEEVGRLDWTRIRGVAVGASLHLQRHQPEAVAFVRAHRQALSAVPALFVSVSLAAASIRASEVAAARRLAKRFAADAGWTPFRVASVAGRLAYTQYNWLVRLLMRRIAAREGGSVDTTRDHEYTDWAEVERLADQLAGEIRRRESAGHDAALLRPAG